MQTLAGKDYFASGHWPVFMQRCIRNGEVISHNHDYMEIIFIVSGTGTHDSVHGLQKVGAGDIFVMRPGAWHAYHDCHKLEVFNCAFGMELLGRELYFFEQEPAISYLFYAGPLSLDRRGILSLQLSAEAIKECKKYLQAMLKFSRAEHPSERITWFGNLLLLLGHLMQALDEQYYRRNDGKTRLRLHEGVREGIRLMEEQPHHQWTLNELAAHVHLDPSYLVRLFKADTGLPPLAYLARCRGEKAASLLLRSGLSIADIGMQVGWSDPSYFSQRFKSHFGLNPREYRARFSHRSGSGEDERDV